MTATFKTSMKATSPAKVKTVNKVLIALFVFSLIMPFFFFLGDLRLSVYRIFLLVFSLPMFALVLSGSAGRFRVVDILVFILSIWFFLSLLVVHGSDQFEYATITVIETLVPYATARVLVRGYEGFKTFVWWHFVAVLFLLPFAIYESMTGRPILIEVFRGVFSVYPDGQHAPRLGLYRAQATLPHAILFGVFAMPVFALSWYVLGFKNGLIKRLSRPLIAGGAVFTSLSSAAFLGIALQVLLMLWDRIFRRFRSRWVILGIVFGTLYAVLELSSNRNVFQILANEISFSAGTAYNRIHIFNNVMDDITQNAVFGIGLNDWSRPEWMKQSIDNFWLVISLRHGLPAFVLVLMVNLLLFVQIVIKPMTGNKDRARTGYLIVLASLLMCASTVHYWDASYCFFMFFLGAGVWFLDDALSNEDGELANEAIVSGRKELGYTRFRNQEETAQPVFSRFQRQEDSGSDRG